MIKTHEIDKELKLASHVLEIGCNNFKCDNLREAVAWLRVGPFSGLKKKKGEYRYWNKQNFIFRGQANSEWRISTTMERSANRQVSTAATHLFSGLTEFFVNNVLHGNIVNIGLTYDKQFGLAAAQHYGMDTNLSDWTTQCEIAANFAFDRFGKYDYGKIFLLPIERIIDNGLQIIFPPSVVKRLYNQRGLFIDLSGDRIKKIEKELISIEFKQISYEDFGIASSGFMFSDGDLLPEDNWFNQLKTHCLERVEENDYNPETEIVKETFLFRDGFNHPFLQNLVNLPLHISSEEEFQTLSNMLKSLTIEYRQGNPILNIEIYNQIKEGNPNLIKFIEQLAAGHNIR